MNAPYDLPDPHAAFEDALTRSVIRRRAMAGLIDLAICGTAMVIFFVLGTLFGILTLGLGFGVLAVLPLIPLLYNWLFILMLSATPGQRMMGLLVRRNADLGPPNGAEALLWAVGFAVTMTLTFGLLWLCMVLLTVRKRALHDMLPGLVVVREAALSGPPLTPPAGSWNMRGGGYPAA